MYITDYSGNTLSWWPAYRAAWILNRLDMPDSALAWAVIAHELNPGNSAVLGEFLRAQSSSPDSVLSYGHLVSGGGVCRFRLAQAELRLGAPGPHCRFLSESLESGTDSSRADAACWISMLLPDRSLELLRLAVELVPDEDFYRTVLAGELAALDQPGAGFEVLERVVPDGYYYWQAVGRCREASGEVEQAAGAFRTAYESRRCPSSAAELGWFLYRAGRDLIMADSCEAALSYLSEASALWSRDSSWAVASDSLLSRTGEFLRLGSTWERLH